MKLNTLNTIIDDILLELRNSSVAESEHISRIQIEQWIHNYRAVLIKQDIDKGRDINPMYVQTIPCVHIDRIDSTAGHIAVSYTHLYVDSYNGLGAATTAVGTRLIYIP